MPDALFDLPDGRAGALEVTTIGERETLEREAIAGKSDWGVPGARWAWLVYFGAGVSMRALKQNLATLVTSCEAHSATDPRLVPYAHRQDAAFEWFDQSASAVSMHGFPDTKRPGAIDVLPGGGGGAVFEHLDDLPDWLARRLRQPDLIENIEKLRATGRKLLHLFLRVHDTAMPFSLYYPLAANDYVPSSVLDAPEGLTGLWLAPAWKNPILRWDATMGWRREDCLG